MIYGVYKLVMEGLVKEFGAFLTKSLKKCRLYAKVWLKVWQTIRFFCTRVGPQRRARLFGTFRLLNIKEREVYQKVWPELGAHAGAQKTKKMPDFGPDFCIKPAFLIGFR